MGDGRREEGGEVVLMMEKRGGDGIYGVFEWPRYTKRGASRRDLCDEIRQDAQICFEADNLIQGKFITVDKNMSDEDRNKPKNYTRIQINK